MPKSISQEVTKFVNEKNLNPVFIYEDLSDKTVRSRVLNETRGLSGIYLILNKVTFDYYIGSASTGRFNARFSNHLFNFNGSKVVKNAVKKHGVSSFAFIVLELFPEIVNKENNKNNCTLGTRGAAGPVCHRTRMVASLQNLHHLEERNGHRRKQSR